MAVAPVSVAESWTAVPIATGAVADNMVVIVGDRLVWLV